MKDELDWQIIRLLQENSRLSYAQIGREIGLSPSAVAERVQRLEELGIIQQYTTLIDFKKVGYSLSAYILLGLNGHNYKAFMEALKAFPEIIHCSRVTGQDCLVMKVYLKDSTHLEQIIDKLSKYGNPSTLVVLSDLISFGQILK